MWGYWFGFLGKCGGRERVKQVLQRRGRKTFFPYLLSVMEEEDTQCRSKRHRFGFFFL
jgi:hypothetical protein